MEYLSKICLPRDMAVGNLHISSHTPISHSVTMFLMQKKHLRLDQLMTEICLELSLLVLQLLGIKMGLAVPFLLALIHCAMSYRPAAMMQSVVEKLLHDLTDITYKKLFLLESTISEDDYANYHDVTPQAMVIEKFTLVCCLDIIEVLMSVCSQFGETFVRQVWLQHRILSPEFLGKMLHENPERFKDTAQVNAVFNAVNMLLASLTSESFAFENGREATIVSSLLNILILQIPIKQGFMFYGLNRLVGINADFANVDATIPLVKDRLNNYIIQHPQPVENHDAKLDRASEMQHECHTLELRMRVATLFETYIVSLQDVKIFRDRNTFKVLVHTVAMEQDRIFYDPRSKLVYLRLQLIACIVRVIQYIVQETSDLSELVYPETVYEMFVSLLRIAFGSESLSQEAQKMLLAARKRGWKLPVYNKWCEARAHELHHLECELDPTAVAQAESEFANGLEFPYESETVELAREILNEFVTHEEADNLYLNMNHLVDNFDEMDLME